jgi:hypothetical protein
LVNSHVISNLAAGAIFNGGPATIRNCLIAYNNNGGIWAQSGAAATYQNCTVASNVSGITFTVPAILDNCIVYHNGTSGTNHGLYNISSLPGVWTNSCTLPMPTGTLDVGNITNAPMFVSLAGGDFHLGSASPCINRGANRSWMTNSVDLDGAYRIYDTTVDIGAYERVVKGSFIVIR